MFVFVLGMLRSILLVLWVVDVMDFFFELGVMGIFCRGLVCWLFGWW